MGSGTAAEEGKPFREVGGVDAASLAGLAHGVRCFACVCVCVCMYFLERDATKTQTLRVDFVSLQQ